MDNQNFYFYFYPNNQSHVLNIMKGEELIRQFHNVKLFFNLNDEIKTVDDCFSLWKSFGKSYGILKKVPFTQDELINLFLKYKIVPNIEIIQHVIKHYFPKYDNVWEMYVGSLILKYYFDNTTLFKEQEFMYLTNFNTDKVRKCTIKLKDRKMGDDVVNYIRKIINDDKLLNVHTKMVIDNHHKVDDKGELYRIEDGIKSSKWLI